jgi:hypothetical protein
VIKNLLIFELCLGAFFEKLKCVVGKRTYLLDFGSR